MKRLIERVWSRTGPNPKNAQMILNVEESIFNRIQLIALKLPLIFCSFCSIKLKKNGSLVFSLVFQFENKFL